MSIVFLPRIANCTRIFSHQFSEKCHENPRESYYFQVQNETSHAKSFQFSLLITFLQVKGKLCFPRGSLLIPTKILLPCDFFLDHMIYKSALELEYHQHGMKEDVRSVFNILNTKKCHLITVTIKKKKKIRKTLGHWRVNIL